MTLKAVLQVTKTACIIKRERFILAAQPMSVIIQNIYTLLRTPYTSYEGILYCRSKLLAYVIYFGLPVLLFYGVTNLVEGSSIFFLQNTIIFLIALSSLLLLRKKRYDAAVFVLFLFGLGIAQLSFLFHEFHFSGRPLVSWTSFAVANGCVAVLISAGFLRKKLHLVVLDTVFSILLLIHIYISADASGHYLTDFAGLFIYFLLSLGFSFVVQHLINMAENLMEERIRNSEEKEKLLQEVHHRVKNQMYTIASLLSLQAKEFEDPEVIAAFEETRQRIRLMQVIYRKLYTGDSFSNLNLRIFLEQMVGELQSAYCGKRKIHIKSDIDDLSLSSDQSFAVAIVVNELVTNAVKYAFPLNGSSVLGEVHVSVQVTNSILRIVVKDNGYGLPEEVRCGTEYGFGLALVQSYVRQYDGTWKCENSDGAIIEVELQLEEVKCER